MTDDHDARLEVKKTRIGALIVWGWTDGRRTISKSENDVADEAIGEAENRFDAESLESGEVVAKVWMDDDETIREIEWADA